MSNQDVTGISGGKSSSKSPKVRVDLEQRKILVSASLISVLVFVMVANQTFLKKKQSPEGQARALANVGRFIKVDQGQLEWQKRLALELSESKSGKRDLASLGRPPNAFDQLRFGFFEGKYSFLLEHGKIKEINFVDSGPSGDRPKFIDNEERFLNENRALFYVDYSHAEMSIEEHQAGFKTKKYNLYKDKNVVGSASVFLGEGGRVHALKFAETTQSK
jgi:hypothetical protein